MKDLNVIYRMCGIPSTNPIPWSQEDKFHLNEVCLKSFLMGFSDIKLDIHFLLDYCDERYDILLAKYVPEYTAEHSEAGINETMVKSYKLASEMIGYVLFQECDYLYRPRIGNAYMAGLNGLQIVSPYDHRNFYMDENIHSKNVVLQLEGETHFRTTERNTMTWATHTDVIRENYETFVKYGFLDDQVWFDLMIAGYQLWTPIPAFATHCVSDYLAPGIDWESLWKAYQ